MRYISIDPVTRVEGEARVVVVLDENDEVSEVYYQVLATRGYESFCINRAVEDLPRITSTVCGVCSWAHHVVSGKAVEDLLGREPTSAARKLRELSYYMQIIDSHVLHLGVMAIPDFLAPELPPLERNIVGVLKKEPRVASLALKSRTYIKNIEKVFGGKPIHASYVVPGGVTKGLSAEEVETLRKLLRELRDVVFELSDFFSERVAKSEAFRKCSQDEAFELRTYYMALVGDGGSLSFYDGTVKVIDRSGSEVASFDPSDYAKYIGEYMSNWSYSKFPYFKPSGWRGLTEESAIRVGPLARLNVANKLPAERASEEHGKLLDFFGERPIHNTMAYHWARVVETVYSVEKMVEMVEDPELTSSDVVSLKGEPKYEGVGVVEAPRGLLLHHYKADSRLLATHVNIITPTTFNNTAISAELKRVVSKALRESRVGREELNRVEMDIRAYDPCNSCAAHLVDLTDRSFKLVVVSPSRGERRVLSLEVV